MLIKMWESGVLTLVKHDIIKVEKQTKIFTEADDDIARWFAPATHAPVVGSGQHTSTRPPRRASTCAAWSPTAPVDPISLLTVVCLSLVLS